MASIEKVTAWVEKNMPEEKDRKCYVCRTTPSKDELIELLVEGEAKIQSFTGRLFCSDKCHNRYLVNEGFIEGPDEDEDE